MNNREISAGKGLPLQTFTKEVVDSGESKHAVIARTYPSRTGKSPYTADVSGVGFDFFDQELALKPEQAVFCLGIKDNYFLMGQ